MRKDSSSPFACKLRTSFLYKFLVSIKQLQNTKKNCSGACIEDIVKFMEDHYNVNGDLISQVENAIYIAEESRLIAKKKNLYSLISPAAALHVIPTVCVKARLDDIQKSFSHNVCHSKKSLKKQRFSISNCLPCTFSPSLNSTRKNNSRKRRSKCSPPSRSSSPEKMETDRSDIKRLGQKESESCLSSPPSENDDSDSSDSCSD